MKKLRNLYFHMAGGAVFYDKQKAPRARIRDAENFF